MTDLTSKNSKDISSGRPRDVPAENTKIPQGGATGAGIGAALGGTLGVFAALTGVSGTRDWRSADRWTIVRCICRRDRGWSGGRVRRAWHSGGRGEVVRGPTEEGWDFGFGARG